MAVLVSEGQAVVRGQPLMVLEAMKMEHRVPAPIDGGVAGIRVKPDDQVAARQVLATIEPEGSPAGQSSKEQGA
jgi:biotin carboxyl carrier protein